MTEGRASSRLRILALLVVVMFTALTVRLWYLQVLAADQFEAEAENNFVRLIEEDPIRGQIFTADGEPIVQNRVATEIRIQRDELGSQAEAVISRLTEVLKVPVGEIPEALDDPRYYPYQPVPVATDVPQRAIYYIAEHPKKFPGVTWDTVAVREYPLDDLASHILGWTSPVFRKDLKERRGEGYDQNDVIGRGGLEQQYERWLRGKEGFVKYQVNAAGEQIRVLGEKEPTAGHDLILTIDSRTQRVSEAALDEGMERARRVFDDESNRTFRADAGAVIVMDPDTGGIVALVSRPNFDPDQFVGGIPQKEYNRLVDEDRGAPLFNRATQGLYAPGSTFKPFIALSALRNGVAQLGGYYPCPSEYVVPGDESGTVFRNWAAEDMGSLSVADSLRLSCDTIYYDWGYRFYGKYYDTRNEKDPTEPLQRDLRQWGFEKPTGIDLPTEGVGNVPDDAWIEELYEIDQAFVDFMPPGEYVQTAIGQGGVEATPLQLATAYSILANGGRCIVPHVASEIRDQSSEAGKLVKSIRPRCSDSRPERLDYSQAELDYIREALQTVVTSGTAAEPFAGFQGSIAGKTGTSQKKGEQDYSWFAAMAPAEEPEYVIVAVVEQGGGGSQTAAPIVRRIVEHLQGIETDGSINVGGQATD
jgi:penicillin-binding protein 2